MKTMKVLKRIHVDFNTMTSAPVDLVKIAGPGAWQEATLPDLTDGERVTLYDADGLEVEATVIHTDTGWWMAAPDVATWRDMPVSGFDSDLSVPPSPPTRATGAR